jgi:UDPglucose 6-dehydrogenase
MKLSVIGGGCVGLVSSICFAKMGHSINLIDIDNEKVNSINSAIPPIYGNGLKELLSEHVGRNLIATTDYDGIPDSDISLICVGTPPCCDGKLDLSMVRSVSKAIGIALRDCKRYHIIAVKSTVPPGTTEKIVMPIVQEYSEKRPQDLGFVMNPEFLREGSAIEDFMNPDRIIIGSFDKMAGDLFEPLYDGLITPRIRTGLTTAEMIKYVSNAFLATKISFSNEMGNICKSLGIDIYDVMNGVGLDHRISPHFLNAGAGFGGSCFPKDVSALISLSNEIGEDPILLKSVMEINNHQPRRIIELLEKRLGNIRGKHIAVLGLAFKNDTDDIRESRAIPVIKELIKKEAKITAYDPKANRSMRRIFPNIEYFSSAAEALIGADACLVMTEWPVFGHLGSEFNLMKSKIIIEGRRILSCEEAEGICW